MKPPRKRALVLFNRYALLASGFLTIFFVVLIIEPYWGKKITVGWGFLSLIIFFLIIISHKKATKLPKAFVDWLGYSSNGRLGYIVLIWISTIYLISSPKIGRPILSVMWPLFILPFLLYILRKSEENQLTNKAILFALITLFILMLGYVLGSQFPIDPNVSLKTILIEHYPNAMILFGALYGFAVIYYALRKTQLDRIRSETLVQTFQLLSDAENPITVMGQIADLLCMKAGIGKRVFILFFNNQTDQLKVVALSGENAEIEENFEIPRNRGISRKAIESRKIVYIKDLSKEKSDYISAGLPPKGSEIAVPIFSGTDGDASLPVGSINVQDDFQDAFTDGDIASVVTFAKLLGSVFHKYSTGFENNLSKRLIGLSSLFDIDDMIEDITEAAEDLFPLSSVYFMKLAPGSGFPLRSVIGKGSNISKILSMDYWYQPDGDIINWVSEWKVKIITNICCDPDENQFSFEQWQNIATKNVKSVYFVPIGSAQAKLGVLLLLFQEEQTFTLIDNIKIIRFSNEVAPHLLRIGYFYPIIRGFANPEVDLHQLTTGLNKGAWETVLKDVIHNLPNDNIDLLERVTQFSDSLGQSLRNIRIWMEEPKYYTFLRPDNVNLSQLMEEAFELVQFQYNGSIYLQCSNNIENISNDLKMMIFSLAIEGVKNAFIHGKTTRTVYVGITRYMNDIVLDISDDGQGLDQKNFDKKNRNQKKTGITKLIYMAELILGVKAEFLTLHQNSGTSLKCVIPMLPLIEEVNSNE